MGDHRPQFRLLFSLGRSRMPLSRAGSRCHPGPARNCRDQARLREILLRKLRSRSVVEMDQILDRLQSLFELSRSRAKLPYLIALVGLLAAWLVVRRIGAWIRQPRRTTVADPSLLIDTSVLPL